MPQIATSETIKFDASDCGRFKHEFRPTRSHRACKVRRSCKRRFLRVRNLINLQVSVHPAINVYNYELNWDPHLLHNRMTSVSLKSEDEE